MKSDESESEEPSETEEEKEDTKDTVNDKEINKSKERIAKIKDHINQKQATLERRLPRVNCAEHIIFVLDLSKEEESTPFQLSDGSLYSYLRLIKKVLLLFIQNKKALDTNHKYALMVLQESPIWGVDFTSNPRDIINEIETLKESPAASNFDLSKMFDLIQSHISLPTVCVDNASIAPPPFIVRTIFIYGRSMCLPQFLNGKESYTALVSHPCFFLDILYIHETPSDENKCEGIFDLLCDLDESGWSYVFEVGRNATKLHNLCCKLMAHPLQRPSQEDTYYSLVTKE